MPTGKATDIPAIPIAATNKILAALKTTPPINADRNASELPWLKSAKNPRPSVPELPRVNARTKEANKIPKT